MHQTYVPETDFWRRFAGIQRIISNDLEKYEDNAHNNGQNNHLITDTVTGTTTCNSWMNVDFQQINNWQPRSKRTVDHEQSKRVNRQRN